METSRRKLQRFGSVAFTLIGAGLLFIAIFWPRVVADFLRSRLTVTLGAALIGGLASLLHPELCRRVLRATCEFRKATDDVTRKIRGGDDDDGPHAA